MRHPITGAQARAQSEPHKETDTRLHGRWLLLTRIVWSVLVAFAIGLFVVSLPGYIAQLQTLCTGASCNSGQLSADAFTTLQHVGFSLGEYVAFNVALILIGTLVSYAIALLLFLRRSDDWMALLVAFMLVEFSSSNITNTFVLSHWVGPVLATILFSILGQLGLISYVLMFYLFPDGRFVPHWTRWVMLLFIGLGLLLIFVPYNSTVWIDVVSTIIFNGVLISLVIAQIYRYRQVSSPMQRQQTKWVVYSLTVTILFVVGLFLLQLFVPTLGQTGSLSASISNSIGILLYLPIPLAFGIAILRYRLYDIDVLINRTLVYGTLSVILALVYLGLIFALQSLLRGIINQNSDVAIVVSTLAIAALFQPLRRRVQTIIDRRFYRRKYDAAKIVQAFSATLRSEVDLSQLSEHLVVVVEETMQPTFVSLWLRPTQQNANHKPWRANPLTSSHTDE